MSLSLIASLFLLLVVKIGKAVPLFILKNTFLGLDPVCKLFNGGEIKKGRKGKEESGVE